MHNAVLTGKKVLLTYSGNGLGAVIAIAFAQAGAQVVIHDRSAAVAAAAVERLALAVPGIQVQGAEGDLMTAAGIEQLLSRIGPVDILVIDALGPGTVDFDHLEEAEAARNRPYLREQMNQLLRDFLPRLKSSNAQQVFALSLGCSSAGESQITCTLKLEQTIASAGDAQGTIDLYAVTVGDLLIVPVADLIKSEVMRTNDALAEISARLLGDHRPMRIQEGLNAIQTLSTELVGACWRQR
jgi:hypothetical protein